MLISLVQVDPQDVGLADKQVSLSKRVLALGARG